MCIHPHICICNSCMIFMHTHTYGGIHTYMYHVYTSIHVYLIFMCGMTVYTPLSWISFMIYIHPYKFMWCSSVIFLYTPTYYCIDFCNYHVETSIHIYHVYATIHVYLIFMCGVNVYTHMLWYSIPPKDGIIALWPSTNGSIPDF